MEHHQTCPRSPGFWASHPEIFTEMSAASSRVPALTGISFSPWIGRDFGVGGVFGTLRVLVVGESHYEWCKLCLDQKIPRDADLTVYCIAERLVQMGTRGLSRHWGVIENAFLGAEATLIERRQFWHSIAYYNFLQMIVGDGPRVPVKPSLWSDACVPFLAVVEALRPNLIAVAGRRVWHQLPPEYSVLPTLHAAGKALDRRSYHLCSGRDVLTVSIPHPSRGLGAPWHPILNLAMKELPT